MNFRQWSTPPATNASALFTEPLSTGIYILSFNNGEEYVGQTVNFMQRFTAHRRRWNDIKSIRFAAVPRTQLDHAEQEVINQRKDAGKRLRNLLLTSHPLGSSALDVTITPQEQQQWLSTDESFSPSPISTTRLLQARDRQAQIHTALTKLLSHPQGKDVIHTLATYIHLVIPYPDEVEQQLWTVTAMPDTARTKENRRLATLSIQNVEMLYLGEYKRRGGSWGTYTVLNIADGTPLPSSIQRRSSTRTYRTAGRIRALDGHSLDVLPKWLADSQTLFAARSLALGQMRKGQAMFSRHHNVLLADAAYLAWEEHHLG